MSDESTYEDRREYLEAVASPDYAVSGRYRNDVAAKLQRSLAAGTVTPLGQHIGHGEGASFHTRNVHALNEPEGVYGGVTAMPGVNPILAEAQRVPGGYFEGPDAIAAAMAAPQWDADAGYREAVRAKIDRSISARFIGADLNALDASQRFTKG